MIGLKKVWRDFTASWGRTLTLVLVLALGNTVFAATFGAYGVLTREIERAYRDTVPASATLELSDVTGDLIEKVAALPDIAAATRRKTLHGRYRTSPDQPWGNALIFVADDFTRTPLALLKHERGADEPGADTVLIERSALPVLGGDLGTSFELTLPGETPRTVAVSGVVHEAALAPANTHASIYVYASPRLAQTLGDSGAFDELRILVSHAPSDVTHVERTAQSVATWITEQGLGQVHEIRVPPPGQHPHQTQMTTVLVLLLLFAVLVFVMSALLGAAILNTLLARQMREIGVLKTLGATGSALVTWYVIAMSGLAACGVALAWVPGEQGALAWSEAVAKILNFDLESSRVPAWVRTVTLGATLLIPVMVTLPTLLRATRVSVTSILQDFGVARGPADVSRVSAGIERLFASANRSLTYTLRNVVRLRRKLALSVALLATSGGVTIAAVSVGNAWQTWSERLRAEQDFDVEVNVTDASQLSEARARVAQLPSVAAVEEWLAVPTAWSAAGGFPLRRTYPDDAHGSFTLLAPQLNTAMLHVRVTEGRWLTGSAEDELVLNQMVAGQAKVPVGARVTLAVEGETRMFTVVGKVEQVGVGATAYVNPHALGRDLAHSGGRLRVKAKGDHTSLTSELEHALAQSNTKVSEVMPLGVYENAMVAHFEILVWALFALAALTALVGTLGLGSTIAVSVRERTRELGVLRAIGGSAQQTRNLVALEGAVVGGVSFLLAVFLGVAMAWALGEVIGRMSFALPLPLTPSYSAMSLWGLMVLVLSYLAGSVPANQAARMTVREAVSHV